jgi:predicted transcriptional regulator
VDLVPSEEEIQVIIDLWNQGRSYGEIAKHLSGKKSTVQRWIESLLRTGAIQPRTDEIRTRTKNATAASITYNQARRIALNDQFFEKITEFLARITSPKDLKDLSISYGIIEDKRHLLEPVSGDSSGRALIEKFSDLLILDGRSKTPQPETEAEHPPSLG